MGAVASMKWSKAMFKKYGRRWKFDHHAPIPANQSWNFESVKWAWRNDSGLLIQLMITCFPEDSTSRGFIPARYLTTVCDFTGDVRVELTTPRPPSDAVIYALLEGAEIL